MSHIKRVLALYDRLKQGTYTISQISELADFQSTSNRQIYRDLKEAEAIATLNNEELVTITGERYNRKIYKIQPKSTYSFVHADDLDTYYISRAVLPNVFTEQRATSLDQLQEVIRQRIVSAKAIKYKTGISESITNSHFYENRVSTDLDAKLRDMLWAIGQQLSIRISQLSGDSTSVTTLVTFPIDVNPIRIIFHRGCFYVATIRPSDLQVLVFQVDHLTFQTGQYFRRTKKLINLVDSDLKNRFGVSHNYDNSVYSIHLRFSDITGKFVHEQNWHHSQKMEEVTGMNGEKNYYITFQCGINRELVGWLFQWMSNVKILGPTKLVKLYQEQLTMIQRIGQEPVDNTLDYSNIFAPDA